MLKARDVFTPGSFPTHTYVERKELRIEERLRDGLDTPGQIVSLSGPSKSGKTVLVEQVVGKDDLIPITGAGIHEPEVIWDRILDWMGEPAHVTAVTGDNRKTSVSTSAKGGLSILGFGKAEITGGGGFESGAESSVATVRERRGMAQVIKEIGGSEFTILLDDFHYMARPVQVEVAKQLKEAARQGLRSALLLSPIRLMT